MKQHLKIQLKNVSKSFGSLKVLDGIDLTLSPQKPLVVIGPSGCGKSVLLKCILGLIPIDEGEIWIDDTCVISPKINKSKNYHGKIGMLFQGGALFDSLPIWHNIAFGLIHGKQMKEAEAKALALSALSTVGLSDNIQNKLPSEISGGMQKRVSLARAVVMRPEILFFDEPTSGLDPIMSSVISHLLKSISEEEDRSSITITHDMHCLSHIAHDVALLYQGKIVWQGTKKEFFKTTHPHAVQFRNGEIEGPFSI